MNKRDFQRYLNRWKLIAEREELENFKAPNELIFRQMLSIWEMSKALGFQNQMIPADSLWQDLQKKWLRISEQ